MKNLPNAIKLYITSLALLAAVILFRSIIYVELNWPTAQAVLFFIVVSIVTGSLIIELPKGGAVSVNFAIDLACVILFGPEIAIWITLSGILFSRETIRGETPYYKIIFNAAQFILSVYIAGIVYIYLGGSIGSQTISSIIPFIGAAVTYFFINISAVTIVLSVVQKSSLWGMWLVNFSGTAANFLAFTPLALLMVAMYKIAGLLGGVLFIVPLLLARFVFKSYMEVRQIYLDTLSALASALDAKDRYTKGHSDRVAGYAVEIARALNMPEDKIETIERMAQLHDIGKIGIGGAVLCKPGKLSDSEFEKIKQHPVIGANILKNVRDFEDITDFVRYHHEKYDGSGYPFGISGEQIPLEARIITLADSFDAMTSNRSYRKAMTMTEALEEVKRCSGKHFDPKIVEAFIDSWGKGIITSIASKLDAEQTLIVS